MKLEALRASAQATVKKAQERMEAIAEAEERLGKDYMEFTEEEISALPPMISAQQLADAERSIEVCAIAETMTDDERSRLAAIPVYSDDVRECKDIKDKYGLSWNEVRMARSFFWGSPLKKTPQDRYQETHCRRYVVKCFDSTEQDMIDWLDKKPNKAGYIKELIKADMAKAK